MGEETTELISAPTDGVQAAIDAGRKIGVSESLPVQIPAISNLEKGEIPIMLVPDDDRAYIQSLEDYMPHPARLRQRVTLTDSESFVKYVNRFKDDNSQVFALINDAGGEFNAIIDYHQSGISGAGARRKDHTATFRADFSEEWKTWVSAAGKDFTHTDFARFIEDNLPDIVAPSNASVLESVRSLQINRSSSFEAAANAPDGKIHFHYVEKDGKNEGRKGEAEFPHEIKLLIDVFKPRPGDDATPKIEVPVRIDYNLVRDAGSVKFVYRIVRPQKIIESAFSHLFEEIEEGLGMKILLGTAE